MVRWIRRKRAPIVTYSIVTDEAATPNFSHVYLVLAHKKQSPATIKVVEKAEEPEENDQQPEKDDSDKGQQKPTDEGQTDKQTKATAKDKRLLPKTGTAITKAIRLQE